MANSMKLGALAGSMMSLLDAIVVLVISTRRAGQTDGQGSSV